MAAAFGTGDNDNQRNVELNVVPFIDLMSCLTAFLLVTAVWTNLAQIETEAPPDARGAWTDEWPRASVLLTDDAAYIGLSRLGHIERVTKSGADHDWDGIEDALRRTRGNAVLADGNPHANGLQIAAEDLVPYQSIVTTMDLALSTGFPEVRLSVPADLPMSFTR